MGVSTSKNIHFWEVLHLIMSLIICCVFFSVRWGFLSALHWSSILISSPTQYYPPGHLYPSHRTCSGLEPAKQLKCEDLNHEESPPVDQSIHIHLSCDRHELVESMTELSLEESDVHSHGTGLESDPSQIPDESSVVSRGTSTSQTSSSEVHECYEPDLAGASHKMLCALDVLAVILPCVRVWFDWLALNKELWMQCTSNIESSIMWVFYTVHWVLGLFFLNIVPYMLNIIHVSTCAQAQVLDIHFHFHKQGSRSFPWNFRSHSTNTVYM